MYSSLISQRYIFSSVGHTMILKLIISVSMTSSILWRYR